MADSTPIASRGRSWWVSALLLAVVCAGIFFRAMDRDLNHDEHQFLAPAALLSREGLLPYRDYPLFHVPNLVFAYAVLDRLTGQLLLMAKCVSVGSTCGVAILLFLTAMTCPSPQARHGRRLLACSTLALFLFDPLTVATTGKTWNHELPALLTVAALLLHSEAGRRDSLACMGASGALLGLAIGTRLTFAPIGMPLALFPVLFSTSWRRRFTHTAVFCLAGVVACAPSLYFLFTDREAFLFGNLEFPRLRLLDPENTRIQKTMTWWRKLRYFAKEIVLPSWPLFAAYMLVGVRPALTWLQTRRDGSMAAALVITVLPFALLGCFAPSRFQYQHYYLFAPLLVLGVTFGAGQLQRQTLVAILAAVSALTLLAQTVREGGRGSFAWVGRAMVPRKWFPAKARSVGDAIRARSPEGKVLTLAPLWVLEGGLQIYPEFATGPFAWRSAPFAPIEARQRLKLVGSADLEALLERNPPAAILTGVEDEQLERPLVAYAESRGYRSQLLSKSRLLWLPPENPK